MYLSSSLFVSNMLTHWTHFLVPYWHHYLYRNLNVIFHFSLSVCPFRASVMTQVRVPTSCPDPDKVNFRPRRGSTFCPVSLHKPHLPSIDFLFRNLSVFCRGSFYSSSIAEKWKIVK